MRSGEEPLVLPAPCRVVALAEHPRLKGRYRVELAPESGQPPSSVIRPDAEPKPHASLVVSVELIAELKLRVGRELGAEECARLAAGARVVACYDRALATLGARARSAADLRRWLRTKEFTEAEIGPVVEKLQGLGLLDDRAFALGFARSRMAPGRGYGPRRVAAELARRGVARGVVDDVLGELAAEGDPDGAAEALAALVAKRRRGMASHPREVQDRRLYGFLARRGYSPAEIRRALRDA